MKSKMLFFSFLALLCFSNSYSYIYRASQLRNPETGQRILLYSDVHIPLPGNDLQKKLILKGIDAVIDNPEYIVISEDMKLEDFTHFSEELRRTFPIFLDLRCSNYKSNIVFADKIRHYSMSYTLELLNLKLIKPNILSKNLTIQQKDVIKGSINNKYKYWFDLSENELDCYEKQLNKEVYKEMRHCINHFNWEYNRTLIFNKILRNEIKSNINLLKDFKFVEFNQDFFETIFTKITDIEMLFAVYRANKVKNIVLFAGGLHTDYIEQVLLKSGYIKEFSSGFVINKCEVQSNKMLLEMLNNPFMLFPTVTPLKDEIFNLISEDNLDLVK